MERKFINKRIADQLLYIDEVIKSNRPDNRKKELVESAAGVLQYLNEQSENNTDIIELEKERFEWALKIFPQATPVSSLRKLEGEIKEVEQEINLAINIGDSDVEEEYADCLMCLFDSAGRLGVTPEIIFRAFKKKLIKNKNRTWNKNPDNTYSHVKNIPKECVEPDIFCCRRVKGTCEQCKNE